MFFESLYKEEKMKYIGFILIILGLITFVAVVGESAQDESLSLYLDFDHVTDGKVIDMSGNGNDGEIMGNPKLEDGKFGKALQFGGTIANKVVVKHNPNLNPSDGAITLMAWMNLDQIATDWDLVILKWQDEAPPAFTYHLSLHTQKASLYFAQKDSTWKEAIGSTVLSPKEWFHITGVADGKSTVKVYLNGEEDGSVAYDGTLLETDVDVCIGGKVAGALFPFHGKMDEVAIFNRALDQSEIKEAMGGITTFTAVKPQDKLATTWSAIKK
jgi:hypothetical protein